MTIYYVKGEFVAAEQAMLSVSERGFRFGDGLFESILLKNSELRHLKRHLARLHTGLKALKIPAPEEDLSEIAMRLIQENEAKEGVLRISISRGIGSLGYLPTVNGAPTVVMELMPLREFPSHPVQLWLSSYTKPSIHSMPVTAKLSQGVNSTLARMEAEENQCDEALLLNDKGEICEASSANIFWRIGQEIFTPVLECGLVAGIAREILLEEWQVLPGKFSVEILKEADSVMLCNSIRGAVAVSALQPKGWSWNDNSLADKANVLIWPF